MRIDLVTLCDAAVEVNGRLHVLGSIDYFWAAALPYTHPQCALAVRFRWDGHERRREHTLRVWIMDGDGRSITGEFTRKLTPPVMPEDIPPVRHLVLELESLPFETAGPYAVRVEVDGEELASLPFSVIQLAAVRRERIH